MGLFCNSITVKIFGWKKTQHAEKPAMGKQLVKTHWELFPPLAPVVKCGLGSPWDTLETPGDAVGAGAAGALGQTQRFPLRWAQRLCGDKGHVPRVRAAPAQRHAGNPATTHRSAAWRESTGSQPLSATLQ